VSAATLIEAGERVSVRGLYIHIPFCFHKCHYCDFYSIVDTRDRQQSFVERLISELAAFDSMRDEQVETIFIGGGTPTLLQPSLLSRLLGEVATRRIALPGAEFTVEANPETVTDEVAEVLAAGGVNRVSVGAQSFDARHLKTLERWHDPSNVERSLTRLRRSGIHNINLDLICAIPGQTLEDAAADLERAIALDPTHLSVYTLIYEPNTPLHVRLMQNAVVPVDEETEAAMFEATIDRLAAAGYEHYEVSNWSKPGAACRHNLLYWTNADWWALGPSAAGHVRGTRWKNSPRLGEYIDSDGFALITDVESLNGDRRAGETLMLRLRLIEGIPLGELDVLLVSSSVTRREAIGRQIALGHLEQASGQLRLTRAGLLVADDVFMDLL
jgi:oxygen-independent coproporphyrinogen-3 oxidase